MSVNAATLLIVDDDDIDVETIRRSFEDLRIANPLRVARDGVEAMDILSGLNGAEKLERPYVILLDINMPRMNGHELLTAIREHPEHHSAPVFILTTSNQDEDMLRAHEKNVAGYILKTNAGPDFVSAIQLIEHYWRYVELPR